MERDVSTAGGTLGDEGAPSSTANLVLVVMEHGALSRYQLPSAGELRVGRAETCDVVVHGAAASRDHALLRLGAKLELEDLQSRNGTRVRERQLAPGERFTLQVGDPIHIGSTMLIVQNAPRSGVIPRAVRVLAETEPPPRSIVLQDPAMQATYDFLERVAPSSIGVLILGETGVGKEVIAATVHRLSGTRSEGPFVCINCAALSESIFESEVFGHQQGSFTGAVRAKQGLLEIADKGTVFLDEVGELPRSLQAKLLRVIETREVTRVGGLKAQAIDVRFVAATNRDLRAEVQAGTFREDLYFRLNGISVRIPPLRERPSEIVLLAQAFLAAIAAEVGGAPPPISAAAMKHMLAYSWPGNIRELKNAIECAALLAGYGEIEVRHLPSEICGQGSRPQMPSLPAFRTTPVPGREYALEAERAVASLGAEDQSERERIIAALAACNGNQTRAAEYLEMPRRTLVSKLTAYGLPRPRKSAPPGR